jgi:hypothetical protein
VGSVAWSRGNADTAARYLTVADDGIDLPGVPGRKDDDPTRQAAALQGIGWALLAIRDLAEDRLADLADATADVAVQVSGLTATTGQAERIRHSLARMVRAWAARAACRVPGPGAVVLSAAEADTAWQALADAAAWHAAQGDCADCTAAGQCADRARHEVIAAEYAALRTRLGGDHR